jgi:hypothetical protein
VPTVAVKLGFVEMVQWVTGPEVHLVLALWQVAGKYASSRATLRTAPAAATLRDQCEGSQHSAGIACYQAAVGASAWHY